MGSDAEIEIRVSLCPDHGFQLRTPNRTGAKPGPNNKKLGDLLMPGVSTAINEKRLNHLSPHQSLLLAYGLMVPLVLADLWTNPEMHFTVFYLAPVMIAAWRASLRSAIVFSRSLEGLPCQ